MIVGTAGHIDHGKTSLVRQADRRRYRPAQGGEGARHLDRSGLCLLAAPERRDHRLRRRAGPRGPGAQHAGRRHRHRFRGARDRRRRRRHAADARAPGDHGPAGAGAGRRRAQQVRSGRRGPAGRGHARNRGRAGRHRPRRLRDHSGLGRDRRGTGRAGRPPRRGAGADHARARARAASAWPSTAPSRWPGSARPSPARCCRASVRVEDRVVVSPSGLEARVRSINAQNRPVEQGEAGQRCALVLSGPHISKEAVRRGDVVLDPALHAPTARIDASLRVLASEPKPIGQWFPVKVHHAAAEVPGRVVVLRDEAINPGETDYVQLVLERPIAAAAGDRFVMRDTSSSRTVGGGVLIDLRAPERRRRTPERRAEIAALAREATRPRRRGAAGGSERLDRHRCLLRATARSARRPSTGMIVRSVAGDVRRSGRAAPPCCRPTWERAARRDRPHARCLPCRAAGPARHRHRAAAQGREAAAAGAAVPGGAAQAGRGRRGRARPHVGAAARPRGEVLRRGGADLGADPAAARRRALSAAAGARHRQGHGHRRGLRAPPDAHGGAARRRRGDRARSLLRAPDRGGDGAHRHRRRGRARRRASSRRPTSATGSTTAARWPSRSWSSSTGTGSPSAARTCAASIRRVSSSSRRKAAQTANGGVPLPVGRPDFKSGWGRQTVSGGFELPSSSATPSRGIPMTPAAMALVAEFEVRRQDGAGRPRRSCARRWPSRSRASSGSAPLPSAARA